MILREIKPPAIWKQIVIPIEKLGPNYESLLTCSLAATYLAMWKSLEVFVSSGLGR